MEGIKKDILIANKLARMQKEINALKPADCDALCAALAQAQEAFTAAKQTYEVAEQDFLNATEQYNIAVADEGEAEAVLNEVLQGNTECKAGCEPLPAGQACQDECDAEFNVGEAQATLDAAVQATADALNIKNAAETTLEQAEEARTAAGLAEKDASEAVDSAGCIC